MLFWTVTVWGPWQWYGLSLWTLAGVIGFAGTLLCSLVIRRPHWTDFAFSRHGLLRWLIFVGLGIVSLGLVLAMVCDRYGFPFPPLSADRVLFNLLSAIIQQAFVSAYMLPRWYALLHSWTGAVIVNAISFGFMHLPDPGLVAVTCLGGLLFGALFLRARNVIVVGVAHAAFALLLLPVFRQAGVIDSTRVGPANYAWFSKTIQREVEPSSEIWLFSQNVGPELRASTLSDPMPNVSAIRDHGSFDDELLEGLLSSRQRVFCVITEREFQRYADLPAREKVFVLGERYLWNGNFSTMAALESWRRRPSGNASNADLRERVLLISNKPPHSR